MSLISGLAIFYIIWWLVLFTVLPWGTTSHHETGVAVQEGTTASSPIHPRLLLKFAVTTVIAAVIFAAIYVVAEYRLVTLDDIPFLPDFRYR